MKNMPVHQRCVSCGAAISAAASDGLCASCLLAPALELAPFPEPPEPGDLTPILIKTATPLAVKFHSFGDYEMLSEIARDRIGVVFRARQLSLNRMITLKFLNPGCLRSSEVNRQFWAEAQALRNLSHPNIVPIYEIGEHQGQIYLSMPFMPGGSLVDRLPASRPLYPLAAAGKLLTTIARAVQYAHERGIDHRDLKPGNIVFDVRGQPQVTDFGLAKILTPTPLIAAKLTTADIRALGSILYLLLIGRPPFQDETLSKLQPYLEQESRLVPTFDMGVEGELEAICAKCFEQDPAQQYKSAEALADDLERWTCTTAIASRQAASVRERQV